MSKFFIILFGTIVFGQSPVDLHKSAQSDLDAGKVSEAESGFNAAIQADPTFAPAYLGLAHTLMRKGDLKKTGNYLKEAIAINDYWKERVVDDLEFRDVQDAVKEAL